MNYQLTNESIIIEGREPIDRSFFEKWLLNDTFLNKDELIEFWAGKIEWSQPEEAIRDFIDLQEAFTPFDSIKKGIDRICK